jgi:hypothetical protein
LPEERSEQAGKFRGAAFCGSRRGRYNWMMLERLLCIDFEASSLDNGYPIEVGIAEVATGAVLSWLIRPSVTWLAERVWSPASEEVHGIKRALLEAKGEPPETVWAALAPMLVGKLLISDNPSFDGRWLKMLAFDAAVPTLEDMDGLAWGLAVKSGRRPDIAWVKAEAEVWAKVPTVHRAGPDALRNALMLKHIAARI